MTDLNEIQELRKMAEAWLDKQDMLLTDVISRLDVVGMKYHDGAVSTLRRVLSKRAQGNALLISKSEFSHMWGEVAGLGNPEMFREELGDMLVDAASPLKERGDYSNLMGGLRDSGESLPLADPAHVAALEHALVSGVVGNRFVDAGRNSIQADLVDAGFQSVGVHLAAVDSNFAIFAAEVDGRGGRKAFFLPAEIRKGSLLLPSVFYGNKYSELTQQNLQSWVDSLEQSDGNPVLILNQLNNLVDAPTVASSDWSGVTLNSSVIVDMPVTTSPVLVAEQVKFEQSFDLMQHAGVDFEQILLESAIKQTPEVIAMAKGAISREIAIAGLRHDAMKIVGALDNGFTLGMHIQGRASKQYITVPIEVNASGSPILPAVFHVGDEVRTFDESTLRGVTNADLSSLQVDATTLQNMTFRELHKSVMTATASGAYRSAEECLAAIEARFGEEYHRAAMEDMVAVIHSATSPTVSKSEFDTYLEKFESEAADRDRDIKMSQNVRLINLE
jgi:hypothetical protein